MNDHHPYDQSLRDKLNRLPVPDVQKSWQDMRMLLDTEMPEDGKSRRRGGWWFFSGVLVFIIAGSWMLLTMNLNKQNVDPPLSSSKNTSPQPATGPGLTKAEEGTQNDSEKPGVEDDQILLSKEENSKEENSKEGSSKEGSSKEGRSKEGNIKEVISDDNENTDQTVALRTPKKEKPSGSTVSGNKPEFIQPGTGKNNPDGKKNDVKVQRIVVAQIPGDNSIVAGNVPGDPKGLAKDRLTKAGLTVSGLENDKPKNSLPGNTLPENSLPGNTLPENSLIDASTVRGIERSPSSSSTSFAETIDSINQNYGSYISYAPVSRKYYRQNKKYGRPANVRPPYTTVDRKFAVGLSLPLVFPVGDQLALSYNVNAGPNTTTDYIPAPHAQYHFNGKSYIQSELQILSPQYIKPALLYQSHTSNNFYQTTSSVSAQKLYYFNVPVSLHYSPFKHFYMGTGLQFSSLLSGVAMYEEQRTGMVPSDSLYTMSYSKFSNDSISDKLSSSEMRLMIDANYYWNKFTVGLRYNQALSNYVSTRAAPSAPLTVDKNKSLMFYLRYNLWEDKKRKNTNTQTLVLK